MFAPGPIAAVGLLPRNVCFRQKEQHPLGGTSFGRSRSTRRRHPLATGTRACPCAPAWGRTFRARLGTDFRRKRAAARMEPPVLAKAKGGSFPHPPKRNEGRERAIRDLSDFTDGPGLRAPQRRSIRAAIPH
jgi:hypothetical protein